jgi:predicted Ser/Thr protein kinase
MPMNQPTPTMDDDEPNDDMVASNCNDADSVDKNNLSAANSDKVTYQHLLVCCQELASTIQNNQSELTKMISFINQAIDKHHKGNKVNVLFQAFSITTLKVPPPNRGMQAQTKSIPNATRMKQKHLGQEFRRGKLDSPPHSIHRPMMMRPYSCLKQGC